MSHLKFGRGSMSHWLPCLTEDYQTARTKSVSAQFTTDLDTLDTDAEQVASRSRRKKDLYQHVDEPFVTA